MADWLKFSFLWYLTGNPVAAALIMLVLWALTDWYTLGVSRRVVRFFRNLQRVSRLTTEIQVNPHNRKARTDLGSTLIELRRFDRAIPVLKPVLDADPDDLQALYLMGVACLGASKVEQGELFLNAVLEADPKYRQSEPLLELGRFRLARGDPAGAKEALGRYLDAYASSVRARYLLSLALSALGDPSGAARERQRAWREYATALPFQRRVERFWAWRARPSRPLLYGVIACMVFMGCGYVLKTADLSKYRQTAAVQGERTPRPAPPESP